MIDYKKGHFLKTVEFKPQKHPQKCQNRGVQTKHRGVQTQYRGVQTQYRGVQTENSQK